MEHALALWLLVGYDPPDHGGYIGRNYYLTTPMTRDECRKVAKLRNADFAEDVFLKRGKTIIQYACLAPDGTWPYGRPQAQKVADAINRANSQ